METCSWLMLFLPVTFLSYDQTESRDKPCGDTAFDILYEHDW
jgi:hypothetical protein